ncbi:MAG: hypothetical protein H7Y00_04315 [Fimbriimonadaceae bacterium]|nr:hypothetical protein [Chitinophagales bacterium]
MMRKLIITNYFADDISVLNISYLNSGLYFFEFISDNEGMPVEKVIVE